MVGAVVRLLAAAGVMAAVVDAVAAARAAGVAVIVAGESTVEVS